jgi:hypothetical protein
MINYQITITKKLLQDCKTRFLFIGFSILVSVYLVTDRFFSVSCYWVIGACLFLYLDTWVIEHFFKGRAMNEYPVR